MICWLFLLGKRIIYFSGIAAQNSCFGELPRASTGPGTGPETGPGRGIKKNSGLRVLTGPGLQYIRH